MNQQKKVVNVSIYKISIEKLFGLYSYEIYLKDYKTLDFPNVLILYGDNGSGKTTILNLLYHTLASSSTEGHKTYVANVRFKKFEVSLADNTIIKAERKSKNLVGAFNMTIQKGDKKIANFNFRTDKKLRIRSILYDKKEQEQYHQLLEELDKLNLAFYFLTDSREFLSYIFEKEMISSDTSYFYGSEIESEELIRIGERGIKISDTLIEEAIDRTERWLIRKVNEALSKSELDINKIYINIIKSISKAPYGDITAERNIDELINLLKRLEKLSKNYSKYLLIAPLKINEIIDVIKTSPEGVYDSIYAVLHPYVDGIMAKLEALQDVYILIEKFINNLNKFFKDKRVEFNINKGIKIYSGESELKHNMLSSGEKQLLMLFCNIFPAREHRSVFIIDEPEISLNIKWQRKLIKSLLELIEKSNIQFIFATHSIELLTQFNKNVVKLQNIQKV